MTIPPDAYSPIQPGKSVNPNPTPQTPGAGFQSYTPETPQAPPKGFSQAQGPASVLGAQPFPMEMAGPSLDSLISQVGTSQDSIAKLRNQLKTQNLTFRRSTQHLMRNKLSDASTHLRAANDRLGVDSPPMPSQAGARPIERFINFVSDGENQLMAAKQQLLSMKKSGDQLRPADFLLIQIKMSQAQQELEYSSLLLGKVIDSIKATLNIAL